MALNEINVPDRPIRKTTNWRQLFSAEMVTFAWAPIVLFCTCHYFTGHEHHWLHDIYRRLYYFPIVFAGLQRGLWGGLVVSVVVSVTYAPHAFTHYFEHDPETHLEKFLEIVFYNVLGVMSGIFSEREAGKQQQLDEARNSEQSVRQELQRAHRLAALGELVAGIAHEIKNPLHTLKGATEILDKIIPREKPESEMWQIVKDEHKRLARIADRFLSFANPPPPELKQTSVREILNRAEKLLSAQARQNEVKLVVEKPDKSDTPHIQADLEQIVQILVDVAINAFRAMESSSFRELIIFSSSETRQGQPYTVICVQNSGPAIPEEHLERIFDPFFTTSASGTGLGLSTAARIIGQHNGLLTAQNIGTTEGVIFKVFLPLVVGKRI